MLFHASMSPSYRAEALHTATTILIAPSCLFILESNHKKRGRQDLERERERSCYRNTPTLPEKVCVVTCSFVFLCSYNQFVSFSEKKEKKTEKKQKKETARRWAICLFGGRLGSGCAQAVCAPCCTSFSVFFFLTLLHLLHFVSSSFVTCLAL